MSTRSAVGFTLAMVGFLMAGSIAMGDRLTLKDGTILEGKVIRKSDGYWIRLDDGTTRTLDAGDVTKFEKAGAEGKGPSSASGSPAADGSKAPARSTASLASVKRKVESADSTAAAVALWQQFIDSKPSADDLRVASDELAKWKKLDESHARKIKGRWVGGQELADLRARIEKIQQEFDQLMKANSTVAAIKKLEEAEQIDPDDYELNWLLGHCSLLQRQPDKAITYFEKSVRLCPKLMVGYGGWGLALIGKNKPLEAIAKFQQAAQISDSPELAHNLHSALASLSPAQRSGSKIAEALATDGILSSKYPQYVIGGGFVMFQFRGPAASNGESEEQPEEWAGTGFIIDSSGLILTNRHVAAHAKSLTVVLNNGDKKVAEVVAIDDEQDLALIRIKSNEALPFLTFSNHDQPAEGADCTVMGYPLYGRLGTNIKVTRGIVTGIQPGTLGPDVLVDAKVNPGNSGGPMLDKHGNVMAIVSMKTTSNSTEDTYGIGLSAGHVKKFLAKNHVTMTTGEGAADALDAEAIAALVKPAAVCILGKR